MRRCPGGKKLGLGLASWKAALLIFEMCGLVGGKQARGLRGGLLQQALTDKEVTSGLGRRGWGRGQVTGSGKKKKEGIMGQVKLWPFKTMPWDCPTQPCRLPHQVIQMLI